MIIAEFSSLTDNRPTHTSIDWAALVERLSVFQTVAEKGGPLWSPVIYRREQSRAASNVIAVTALCFDFDHVQGDMSRLDELLAPFAYCAHTTFSCSADNLAFRLVIPFDSPIRRERWEGVWDRAYYWVSSSGLKPDRACRDASRIYYWPQQRSEGAGVAWSNDGDFLNPEVLPELPPPPRARPVYNPSRTGPAADPMKITEGCIRRARPGKRAVLGFWLARKLRDKGISQEAAEACLLYYQSAVGDEGFTRREALNAVKQAFRRPPQLEATNAGSYG